MFKDVVKYFIFLLVVLAFFVWKFDLSDDIEVIHENSKGTSPNNDNVTLRYLETTVDKVIDGDTFSIASGEKVRLIGVNTPESVHPNASINTEKGILASEYTKSLLKSGQTVYLISDVDDKDEYGRLLRYVYLEKPSNLYNFDIMLNAILVKNGYAEVMTVEPNVLLKDEFNQLYEEVKSKNDIN